MRNITNIKRIVITIVAIAIGYFMFQTITSSATAVAKQENPVQLVSTQPETEIKKAVPVRLNGQERKVAYLTFDDGPGKYTAQLLDILKENDAKATFFLIGQNVKSYPDLVKREEAEGHYVGMTV